MLKILNLGAGVQSTTVLLMSCVGELPRLDAAVFADTQWEPKPVYRHLDWLEKEAAKYGIRIYRVTRGNLREDAIDFRRTGGKGSGLTNKRYASMPLFVLNPDGTVGIINRQCTSEYKIEVIEKCIRRELLGLKPRQKAPAKAVEQWLGISQDEAQRRKVSQNHWSVLCYPLIDMVKSPRQEGLIYTTGYTRNDCLAWLRGKGYPRPPRSACVGCPFHTDLEWLRMKKEDPEAWQDAVEFDRDIRAASAALIEEKMAGRLIGLPFLHHTCVPLDQVVFKMKDRIAARVYGMGNECSGHCGV